MPKRHRDLKNRDLQGTNIKAVHRTDGYDYYYRMPDGHLEKLGKDRKAAIEAALILNQHLRPAGNIAARIITHQGKAATAGNPLDSLDKLITKFYTHYLPEKKHSEKTLEEKGYKLESYRKKWGGRSTASITVTEIAGYLDTLTPNAYIKHRALLKELFGYSIHQGFRTDNPVSATLEKHAPPRARKKHTLEGYQKIYAAAPNWLKRAMDIALRSIQRRADLTRLHTDQIDMQSGTIDILQRKSRNYKHPVNLRIQMGDELKAAVQACLDSGINCPYLIHYRPLRMTKKTRAAKLHPFCVTDNHLTKTFSAIRDNCGAYDHLPPDIRPGFHDLRGLGAYLYQKAGFHDDYTQALSGHASKAMLDHYIAGHEAPIPVTVSADLTFSA